MILKTLLTSSIFVFSIPVLAGTITPGTRAVELVASCQSPRYAVVIQKSTRGISATVRGLGQSVTEPNLQSIQVESAIDSRFALTYVDRANSPIEFKFGIVHPAPRQRVQAILERAILDDGTVITDEQMICIYPISR